MLPTQFRVNWPFSSEEVKIDFHLGFPMGTILTPFDLQVTLISPIKFQANWPFGSGEEAKNRFSKCHHGGHLGFLIRRILAL